MRFCVFAFVCTIFVKKLTVYKCFWFVCLQFSKLILLIRESMGFRSQKHGFYPLKPLVSQPETHAFRP